MPTNDWDAAIEASDDRAFLQEALPEGAVTEWQKEWTTIFLNASDEQKKEIKAVFREVKKIAAQLEVKQKKTDKVQEEIESLLSQLESSLQKTWTQSAEMFSALIDGLRQWVKDIVASFSSEKNVSLKEKKEQLASIEANLSEAFKGNVVDSMLVNKLQTEQEQLKNEIKNLGGGDMGSSTNLEP